MNSTVVRVPALIGGVPDQTDFAPSILFAVLYFLSLIPYAYHLFDPDTRTITFCIGTVTFSIERIVVWSLRAGQAKVHHPGDVLNKGVLVYLQVSYALGFLSFAADAVGMARAVLVNATLEDPSRGSPDEAQKRVQYRRGLDCYNFVYLVATVTGVIAYGKLPSAADSQSISDDVYNLRYVSTGFAFAMVVIFTFGIQYLRARVPFVDKKAMNIISAISVLTAVICIYRLVTLSYHSSFLNVLPSPPYPLTNTASKATFYIFHALPELLIAGYIQTVNLRAVFNTGPWGDWQGSDRRGGIPRLRQNGVFVDGVGVEAEKSSGQKKWNWPRWVLWLVGRSGEREEPTLVSQRV